MQKRIHDPKQFGKVAVVMGGDSAEREISLLSGKCILEALQRQGINAFGVDLTKHNRDQLLLDRPDRVFIALHGKGGEDGVLQGALESLHIPYTGSGVGACALAMDKLRTKLVWQSLHLSTPDFLVMKAEHDSENIISQLGLPLFLKPIDEGSSVGVSKILSEAQLRSTFAIMKKQYAAVLVEKYIEGPEYTVGFVGEMALPSIWVRTPRDFYDYEAKYLAGTTEYVCPSGLNVEEENLIQALAKSAYEAIGCRSWGRVDLMRDATGKFYLLEVNTVPGMTDHSLVPMAARQLGMTFEDLVWLILEDTFIQYNEIPD